MIYIHSVFLWLHAYICVQVKILSESYLQEAEWCHNKCKPTFEEQVKVSTVSAGGQISSVVLLLGMGDEATIEAFEWAMRSADAVLSFGQIARFMNDIASFNVYT